MNFLLEISKAIMEYGHAPTLSEKAAKQQQRQNLHLCSCSSNNICVTWSINYRNSSGGAASFSNDIQSCFFSGRVNNQDLISGRAADECGWPDAQPLSPGHAAKQIRAEKQ